MSAARERAQQAQHDTYRRMLWHVTVAEFAALQPAPSEELIPTGGNCAVCGEALTRKAGRPGRPPKFCPSHQDWPADRLRREARAAKEAA